MNFDAYFGSLKTINNLFVANEHILPTQTIKTTIKQTLPLVHADT